MNISKRNIELVVNSLMYQENLTDDMIVKRHGVILWKTHDAEKIKYDDNLYGFPLAKDLEWSYCIDLKEIFYTCIMQSNVPQKHKEYIRMLKEMANNCLPKHPEKMLLLLRMIYLYVPYINSLRENNVYDIISKKLREIVEPLAIDINGTVYFSEDSFHEITQSDLLRKYTDKYRLNYFEMLTKTNHSSPLMKSDYTFNPDTCEWGCSQYDTNQTQGQ